MIIYLYGTDSYRRSRKAQDIIADYRRRNAAAAVRAFDFSEEGAVDDFMSFFSSQSLFSQSVMGVLKNVFARGALNMPKDARSVFKKRLRLLCADTEAFLLFSEDALPASFAFLTAAPARTQRFLPLASRPRAAFLKKELEERHGVSPPSDVIDAVAEYYGDDVWGAMSALIPLGFAPGASSDELLMRADIRPAINFFPLIQELRHQSLVHRLEALERLSAHGEDAAKIFALISYQQEYTVACAEYDASLKAGGVGYEEALADLVIR